MKLPVPNERLIRFYRSASMVLANTLVLFVVINLLIAALLLLQDGLQARRTIKKTGLELIDRPGPNKPPKQTGIN